MIKQGVQSRQKGTREETLPLYQQAGHYHARRGPLVDVQKKVRMAPNS
jgi:hypothetical protein